MNPDPPEEPDFRGQTLSPVSPKPLHLPMPSNIPLLEDQMDPGYTGSANYSDQPKTLQYRDSVEQPDRQESVQDASDGDIVQNGDDASPSEEISAAHGLSNGITGSAGRETAATDHPYDPGPSNDLSSALGAEIDPTSTSAENNGFDASGLSDTQGAATDPLIQFPTLQSSEHEQQNGLLQDFNTQTSGVNIQALLENLSSSVVGHTAPAPQESDISSTSPQSVAVQGMSNPEAHTSPSNTEQTQTASLPSVAGLPPRPPPQENPTNLVSESDLRSYHFHDHQQPSTTQKYAPPPSSSLQPPGNLPPPVPTAGAPGTTLPSNNLPPPPLATFQQRPPSATHQSQASPSSASYGQREAVEAQKINDDYDNDHEQRWSLEVQKKYDSFLEDERMYVTRGEWHTFPSNSRLFIGNLPTEKVTKRDLFHVFHKYGKLAQVSIKQAYGFIQFLEAQDCLRALQAEQGVSIRGRKIHLEISKPQRGNQSNNSGGGEGRSKANRRSRSPDHARGGAGAAGNQRGADRYRSGNDARHRESPRGRDDYRPGRSPSPRSRGSRRSPNRRRRSRSRSPRNAYRSSSPRRGVDDDCPLPRRAPQDIPDVQILAKDDPDRAFVSYVEKSFEARGIKCNVLILSPRLLEASVVRRQIIEGVLAVLKLDRTVQATQKFHLSVFDRSGGANNVKFEEYADLALNICVELVLRAKQIAVRAPAPQFYGLPVAPPLIQSPSNTQPSHQQQTPYQQFSQPPQPSNQFSPLDTSSLQQLLGRVQQSPPQQPTQQSPFGNQPSFSPTSDLSRLLASVGGGQHQQNRSPFPHSTQPQQPMNHDLSSLAGLLAGQGSTPQQQQQQHPQNPPPPQQQAPQSQQKPDMANLMAMLGRYK